ncbi:MAG: maleylpyruvate isomerase N-terminal domain-containing protein [Nocardioides sp.]
MDSWSVAAWVVLSCWARRCGQRSAFIEGTGPQQWNAAKPCEGMEVAPLVQHLAGGIDEYAAIPTTGQSAPTPEVRSAVPALEHHEAPAAYFVWCERLTTARSVPGMLGRSHAMQRGETPGRC